MSQYGFRDGMFNARAIKLGQKRYKEDAYHCLLGSALTLGTLDVSGSATTYAFGTAIDHPRTLKFLQENGGGHCVRQKQIRVKGYSGQGEYVEELITLGTTDNAVTRGVVPFAHIDAVAITDTTKAYGSYGTVSAYPTQNFGITEYIEDISDGLDVAIFSPAGVRTVSTAFAVAAKYSKANQTLHVSGALTGSTIGIKYLSKFQKRLK